MPTPFSRSSSTSPDASHRLVSSRCPECGAPVDFRSVPPTQAQVKCAYCGTLITIPGRTHSHTSTHTTTSTTQHSATIVVTSNGSFTKRGQGCGAAAWLVVIVLIISVISAASSLSLVTSATRFVSNMITGDSPDDPARAEPGFQSLTLPTIEQALGPKPRLANAPVILGGSDSAATQMVVVAYQDDGVILLGFDPTARAETWRSPLLSEQYYELGVGADGARVYVADGASLMALDRTAGKVVWQSSLTNNIQSSCSESDPCLQVVGDQVVTLARDGTLQGFAGASGTQLWSRRLNSQPRQFLVNNNQVIVVDNDESNRAVVFVLNGANGDVIYELRPSCTFPTIQMRPHPTDQFLVTPDGSALLVVGSGTYACAWRYSLSDGTLTWSYTPPGTHGPLPLTWSMSSLTVADPVVYFIKDEGDDLQIYALDTQIQGTIPQTLYQVSEYDLTILYAVGDLLLVSAQPDFAAEDVELWAIDRNTGERRWQRKLETMHAFDDWVTRPAGQGIFLVVCYWDNDDCRFELLDLATGVSKGQVRETTSGAFSGAAWRGDQGFLTIDGKLYAIDLPTATVAYTWP